MVGISLRQLNEKAAVPASQVEFQRRIGIRKDFIDPSLSKIVFRDPLGALGGGLESFVLGVEFSSGHMVMYL